MDLLREELLWNTQRNPTAEAFSKGVNERPYSGSIVF